MRALSLFRRSWWVLSPLSLVACDGGKLEITAPSPDQTGNAGTASALPPERHPARPCPAGSCPGAAGGAGAGASSAGGLRAPRVLIVSVDGLGAVYLDQQLALGRVPNLARLRGVGASTLDARTDVTHTITLPNHTSIVTGRPVWQVEGASAAVHHGYTNNVVPPEGETLHNAGNPALSYVASLFDVAHDHGLSTCLYAGKPKFVLFAQSYDDVQGAPDQVGEDNGRRKIDHFSIIEDETLVETAAAELATGKCDVALLHIPDLDTPVGHSEAWGSEAWVRALERVDGWLGSLQRALFPPEQPPGFALILTADHGGKAYGHALVTDPETYRIPFLLVASGVPAGADLYDLVRGHRTAPGNSQPSYAAPDQPIRNGDAANLALGLLGLPPVPGSSMRDLGLTL